MYAVFKATRVGHIIAFHDSCGCSGVTLLGHACDCKTSNIAALDAGIKSFEGSPARLRRNILHFAANVTVRRAVEQP
jgi:hypothetical protein